MINLKKAQESFKEYLKNYNIEDGNIKLKIKHTYEVVNKSNYISMGLDLNQENTELAQLIALLHDIGRFEQVKQTSDFLDSKDFDHASYGIKVLFEENLIRKFVEDSQYDNIIKKAIYNHNKYKIEENLNDVELLHSKIIRDADKLDNCRVKLEDAIETMLEVSKEEVGKTRISKEVMEQFENRTAILSETRKTKMDYWMSYLAYFFDVNFKPTYEMINENHYVDKLVKRIPYANSETKKKMERVREKLNLYIQEKCSE